MAPTLHVQLGERLLQRRLDGSNLFGYVILFHCRLRTRHGCFRGGLIGNMAAFKTADDRSRASQEHPGDDLDWSGARALLTQH